MSVWIILAVLVAVAAAAPRYGADTRTGGSWTTDRAFPHTPAARATLRGDLAAVRQAIVSRVRGSDINARVRVPR